MKANLRRKILPLVMLGAILALSACSAAGSPTRIEVAGLYLDPAASQPTDTYGWLDIFYCAVNIAEPAPDSVVKASWVVVESNRTQPNMVIKIEEKPADSSQVIFSLENLGNFWPTGSYQVYLYLNDKLDRVLDFKVVEGGLPE